MEFDFTKDYSCLMSYSWDWATDKKNPQELYRLRRNFVPTEFSTELNYGKDVVTTKNRIRGRGRSLAIRLTSPQGKATEIVGLAVMYTGEA